MSPTSIPSGFPGSSAADLIRDLNLDLAQGLGKDIGGRSNQHAGVRLAGAEASQSVDNVGRPMDNPPSGPTPVTDVAAMLLSQVATSDLTKLTRILNPAPDDQNSRILDSLLQSAVKEVANGNAERAVGYLADYATRDPQRAEMLPFEPALDQVRDKIDSMVSRMTVVAKMSAEDGLSRAEQSSVEMSGKISDWDTHSDVILKIAHRLFDAGGYANYARTSDLARIVSMAAEMKPVVQVLAASASGSAAHSMQINQPITNPLVPGINVPYWAISDFPIIGSSPDRRLKPAARRAAVGDWGDVSDTFRDLQEISSAALRQLWRRAPLLVMMLTWLVVGLAGGFGVAIASHIWPDSVFVALSGIAFNMWGIGFLALVGFSFFMRVRNRPLY
jgi:hypothetical protein